MDTSIKFPRNLKESLIYSNIKYENLLEDQDLNYIQFVYKNSVHIMMYGLSMYELILIRVDDSDSLPHGKDSLGKVVVTSPNKLSTDIELIN